MALTMLKKPAKRILGLDISTKTGYAILCPSEGLTMRTLHYKPTEGAEKYNQYARWQKYEDEFNALLAEDKPEFAVIEGYGFASQSLSVIVEVSAHFKRILHRRGIPWVELKPTALKKFVTGKGAADKNVMLLEAYKRFGIDTKDDNQCDAACLAFAGTILAGWGSAPKLPAVHLEALKDLKKPDCS